MAENEGSTPRAGHHPPPPPPDNLRGGDRVAVIGLTGAFDLDPDGHMLGLHPERATVTWMSLSEWRNAMEGDG